MTSLSFDRLVGIPHAEDGRGRSGASCYGLVSIAFREVLGVDLPEVIDADTWIRIEEGQERPFDVILMRERPWHVGLVTRRGSMLHMPEGKSSVIEPYTTGRHARRVEGIYRHISQI